MARAVRQKAAPVEVARVPEQRDIWRTAGPLTLILVILFCYWTPMTSSETSILWDAADYYQVVQDYLSRELHAGRIPFWTPYPWAGYPFLADPQVGAWYPLNWPFFLIGVSPRILVVEHFLHSLLAAFGAYLLGYRLLRSRPAAVVAGLCYGLSGFHVGHSSHTTMLQCAAWTPWLLLFFDRALESRPLRNTVLGSLAAGLMIIAGHFQTILYSFAALALFAAARLIAQPRQWPRALSVTLAIPVTGTFLSAVATLPGLELVMYSVRASLAAVTRTEGFIPIPALATLFFPDFYGALSGNYSGPQDITQYYFYGGILLVPLAVAGLRLRAMRWIGVLLVVPAIWYALGNAAGLYQLIARLPGFSSVRAPVNIWFVPALGLGLLAGAGLADLSARWPLAWLPAVVVAFFAADLLWFQSAANPLAYSRESYESLYGSKEDLFRRTVVAHLPPLTRFDAPEHLAAFGPMSHFFDQQTEVTYGYGPMPLATYKDYQEAMATNRSLRDGLNVGGSLDAQTGAVGPYPGPLPRANFPEALVKVQSREESKARLATLHQKTHALVPAHIDVARQDGSGTAVTTMDPVGRYHVRYRCASDSLLRVGSAYFPGWTARVGSRELPVFPVDHALLGVVLPAGEGELDLEYRSRFLLPGALVTMASLAICAGLLWRDSL